MGRIHNEDVWIPAIWEQIEDSSLPPVVVTEKLRASRLAKETPNHRLLRRAYAYLALPRDQIVRELLLGELGAQHKAWMGNEFGSQTYAPFYSLAVSAMTLRAAERKDDEIRRHGRAWLEALRAVYAWQSVPGGWQAWRELEYGDVVPVGARANRKRNRDESTLLRLLCGETTRRDRRVIARAEGEFNFGHLALVARLLEAKVLPVRPLDLLELDGYLPSVQHPVTIRRWATGYAAHIPRWEGLGPVQSVVVVDRRRILEIRQTRKTATKHEWLDEEEPAPLGDVLMEATLGPGDAVVSRRT